MNVRQRALLLLGFLARGGLGLRSLCRLRGLAADVFRLASPEGFEFFDFGGLFDGEIV